MSGLGVFAKQLIHQHELVAVWGGIIYSLEELEKLEIAIPHFRSHPYQVAEGFFMASSSLTGIDDAERFNHSCAPNVGVKGQILLLARRDIEVGEELMFDYETTDTDLEPFDCTCGSSLCRHHIDGSSWKNPMFQKQNEGWFSWYLAQRIAQL